jgi:hypothetical protein
MTNSPYASPYAEEIYRIDTPVLVILDTRWVDVSEEARELLSKILCAVHCSLDSVRIVNQETLDLSSLPDVPLKVIAFVKAPKGVAMNEKISTPKTDMVVAEALSVLLADEVAKRKFWAALKTLF